jgi:hypothetical protein
MKHRNWHPSGLNVLGASLVAAAAALLRGSALAPTRGRQILSKAREVKS